MNLVIPMAGRGSRFRAAGFSVPKPLIPVQGKPMYAWSTDSVLEPGNARLIFVLLASAPGTRELRADIERRYAALQPAIIELPATTEGQAETVLAAKALIDSDEPLLIHNADTAFSSRPGWMDEALAAGADGALLVFRSSEPRWSYSRQDSEGWVEEVREKAVISPWASTGSYWFRRGSDFVALAEAQLREVRREGGEFYVAPLYNDLLARGGRVRNYEIDQLLCFGTPEDLRISLEKLGGPERDLSHGA